MWTQKQIEETKAAVRAEILKHSDPGDPHQGLWFVLEKIQESEEELTPQSQLERYIYVVSSLVHHAHFGGLKPRQIEKLIGLAEAVLALQGIKPSSSKLGFLYGELYLAVSQIQTQQGQHWDSIWGQQLSFYLSQRAPSGGKGFQALLLAIRAFRLGHSQLALRELERAEKLGLDSQYHARVELERLKALRLSGQYQLADTSSQKAREGLRPNAAEVHEFDWEEVCRVVARTREIAPLVQRVQKKDSPHHRATYLCEAFLWTRIVKTREYLKRFPTARSLARDPHISVKGSHLYPWVSGFETLYDVTIPTILRLRRLGQLLSEAHRLPSVDTELLIWAAAARWLARNRIEGLAAATLAEYRGLSLRLTGGKSADALGVVGDLAEGSAAEEDFDVAV